MALAPDSGNTLEIQINGDGSGLTNAVENSKSSLSGLKTAVGAASVALGGLAASGIAKSIGAAADFESQMADVQKVTDADTAAKLEQEFMSLAETIPISQGELAALGEQAGKFGIQGSENISKFVETVGQISSATDLAADEAGTRFAKIAGAIGLPFSEIDKLGNAVNSLADNFKTDAGEVTDTAMRASNVLSQQLGLGKDTVLALSASMNEVSSSSRLAAGNLKRSAEALMDPKRVGEVANALGMNVGAFQKLIKNSPEKAMNAVATAMNQGGKRATALREALGTQAARGFSLLGTQMGRTRKAMGTVNQQFKSGGSLAREMKIRTNTLSGQYQLLKNRVSNAAITIGQAFLPIIKEVIGFITPLIDKVTEFVDGLSQMELVVGTLVPTIGLLVGGGALLLSQFGMLAPLVSGLGAAFAALSLPVLGAVGAVGLLVAAFSGKLPEILATVDRVFAQLPGVINRTITSAVSWVTQTGLPMLREGFATMVQNALQAWDLLQAWLPPRVRKAIAFTLNWLRTDGVTLATQAFQFLAQQGAAAFDWLTTELPSIIGNALSGMSNWIRTTGVPMIISTLRFLGTEAANAFDVFQEKILPVIVSAIESGLDWIRTTGVPMAVSAFQFWIAQGVKTFQMYKNQVLPFIIEAITAVVNWIRTTGAPLALKGLQWLATKAVEGFEILQRELPPLVRGAIQAIATWIRGPGVALATQALDALWRGAEAAFDWLSTDGLRLAKQGLNAVWQWVKGPGVALATQALDALWKGAKAAFDWLSTDGVRLVKEGLRAAFQWVRTSGVPLAKKALDFLAKQAVKGLDALGKLATDAVKLAIGAVETWLRTSAVSDIKGAFRFIGQGIRTVVEGLFNLGKGIGGVIKGFIENTLVPYLKNDAWGDLKAAAEFMFDAAIVAAEGVFNLSKGIGGIVKDLISGIVRYLKNDAWSDLKGAAEFLFDAVIAAAEGLYDGLIGKSLIPDLFDDIANFIKNFDIVSAVAEWARKAWLRFDKFTTDVYNVVKNGIGAVADWIKNDAAGDLADAASSAASGAANALKNAFNNALPDKIKIPKISVGGGKIGGVKIPKASVGGQSLDIPKLATGGVVTGPTLAAVGEGREPEVVVPLSKLDSMLSGETGGARQVDVTLAVEGDDELARLIRENASVVVENRRERDNRHVKRNATGA